MRIVIVAESFLPRVDGSAGVCRRCPDTAHGTATTHWSSPPGTAPRGRRVPRHQGDGGPARAARAPGGTRVLCVTRLAPEKSLRRLVELGRRHPDLSILLVGGEPQEAALRRPAPGNVRCVNPDRRLAGLARLRGWEIRRFRLHPRELGHPERISAPSVTLA